MTFKSLMNFGGVGKSSYAPVDRYHSGSGGGYHHGGWHGGHKGKGSGSGAALSALTLLAFLFLINVMQQSMDDANSTVVPTTAAVLLREGEVPVVVDARDNKGAKDKDAKRNEETSNGYVRVNK